MQEILAQIFSVVWGVWRHRWMALGISWAVAMGGWLWVWQLPESYVATARVFVDTNTLLKPLLKGLTIQPNTQDRIVLLSRTLLSRPNLEKLMRMTDLDLEVTTPQEQGVLISQLEDAITLTGGEREAKSLYSIKVQDPDRETAKRIAQALVTVFIESSLSGKREDATGSLDYLDEKIREYEANLIATEGRVARFKQQHFDIVGVEGGFYATLNREQQNLKRAELSLQEEQNRAIDLGRQIAGEDPLYNPLYIPAAPSLVRDRKAPEAPQFPTPYDGKIRALNDQLRDLSLKYTERHPEVRQAKSLLGELKADQASYSDEALVNFLAQANLSGSGESSDLPKIPKPAIPVKQSVLKVQCSTLKGATKTTANAHMHLHL